MRVLWLYAHPCPESFHGALQVRAVAAAHAAGHEVDLCDLVAEGFDPVMRADERRRYHDAGQNRVGLEPWIQRILQAEWLVCQFPVWGFGPPAILKGFFDRTFLPDLAFDLSDPNKVRSKFTHLPGHRVDQLRAGPAQGVLDGRPAAQVRYALSRMVRRKQGPDRLPGHVPDERCRCR